MALELSRKNFTPYAPKKGEDYMNARMRTHFRKMLEEMKRDLSQDIVNYNYGSESDEGTRNVYIIDIIGGHCGNSPSANWQDQTGATAAAGTIGIWTLMPYLAAGYPITSDEPQPQQ